MLVDELGLDPGRELVELEQLLLRQDPSLDPAVVREVSSGCPYRGLLPYDAEDADSFFGRENDVAACLRRLRETGVLAVVGPSGVGKSSLVRAGVVAALARTETAVLVTTPGAHPLDSLARLKGGGRQTLVVDQAEDAVTACTDPGERERYFAALAGHVAAGGALALAMRADHLGDLAPYPEIARIVEDGLYLLGPMSEPDLRSAVEGPARQAGLRLEPGLVDLLVRDVEGEPAALPLLSHVLRETWERREGPTLTVAGYRSTGGIRSAVSQSAERLYDAMDAAQRGRLRSLLLRLVVPTGGGDPVRARVPRAKVSADGEHRRLVEQLVDARLVSVDGDSLQIAHESLVRVWPRLRGWLDDDLDGQRLFRHLADAADAWDQMGRPDSELYRGAQGVLHEDVAAGLLLAVEGVQADQSSQAWENLGATLTRAGALSVVRDVGDMVGAPGTAEMPSVSTSSAGGLVAGNVLGDVARLFDEATLAPLPFRQAPRDTISVAMSPDGSRLAVTTAGNDDRPVKLYDLPNGTPAQRQPGGVPAALAVGYEPNDPEPMFSRDGSRMVTALRRPSPLGEWSSWGRTMVWDVADPSEPVFTIRLPASAQSALSPDGRPAVRRHAGRPTAPRVRRALRPTFRLGTRPGHRGRERPGGGRQPGRVDARRRGGQPRPPVRHRHAAARGPGAPGPHGTSAGRRVLPRAAPGPSRSPTGRTAADLSSPPPTAGPGPPTPAWTSGPAGPARRPDATSPARSGRSSSRTGRTNAPAPGGRLGPDRRVEGILPRD